MIQSSWQKQKVQHPKELFSNKFFSFYPIKSTYNERLCLWNRSVEICYTWIEGVMMILVYWAFNWFGEMKGVLSISFLFCCLLLFLDSSISLPLCVDSRAPFTLNKTLAFCPYNGSTCCNSTEDAQIEKQFRVSNVSDSGCASVLKSILCAVSSLILSQKRVFR